MSNNARRGFSLVEVMIAGALLGLIGAGVFTAISQSQTESQRTRARSYASSEIQTTMDRINILVGIAGAGGLDDATLCAMLQASGGPLDVSTGGSVTGTCPNLTATGLKVANSTLTKDITITNPNIGNASGLKVKVRVNGSNLPTPGFIENETHLKR